METTTFETMPQAITELLRKVDNLQKDIAELKKNRPPIPEEMIGVDEACRILHRAKSTVYALAQAHKIPFYQPGKMLQFKRSELIAWMESHRQETREETFGKIAQQMQKGVSHKPKNIWGNR